MLYIDNYQTLLAHIPQTHDRPILIAIDGRPCSGKTTLALQLAESLQASILHLDDFFIPQKDWPIDIHPAFPFPYFRYNEFFKAVKKLASGNPASYFDYDWQTGALSVNQKTISPTAIIIVEGVSVFHTAINNIYATKIWVTSDPQAEMAIIKARENKNCLQLWEKLYLPSVDLYTESMPCLKADIIYSGREVTAYVNTLFEAK